MLSLTEHRKRASRSVQSRSDRLSSIKLRSASPRSAISLGTISAFARRCSAWNAPEFRASSYRDSVAGQEQRVVEAYSRDIAEEWLQDPSFFHSRPLLTKVALSLARRILHINICPRHEKIRCPSRWHLVTPVSREITRRSYLLILPRVRKVCPGFPVCLSEPRFLHPFPVPAIF